MPTINPDNLVFKKSLVLSGTHLPPEEVEMLVYLGLVNDYQDVSLSLATPIIRSVEKYSNKLPYTKLCIQLGLQHNCNSIFFSSVAPITPGLEVFDW